jgi:hypothetical protein
MRDVQQALLQRRIDLQRAVLVSLIFPPFVTVELCRVGLASVLLALDAVAGGGTTTTLSGSRHSASDCSQQLLVVPVVSRLLRLSCALCPATMKPLYAQFLAEEALGPNPTSPSPEDSNGRVAAAVRAAQRAVAILQ